MSKTGVSRLLLSMSIFLLFVEGSGFAQSNAKLWAQ